MVAAFLPIGVLTVNSACATNHMMGVTGDREDCRLAWVPDRCPAREPCLVVGSELDCDLGAGVAGAHHQHPAFLDLGRVAVLLGVELDDALVELPCERRGLGL